MAASDDGSRPTLPLTESISRAFRKAVGQILSFVIRMDLRHEFGRAAERKAEQFYLCLGYQTIARNFRTKGGELDLVMKRGEELLFLEVKGRRGRWEQGAWAPSWRGKNRRIRAAIGVYLAAHPELDYREIRIEVVFVTPTRVEACYEGI